MASRGLIVGKFYPPHRGHHFLIDTALARVDELSVIVCGQPAQDPAGGLRAAWLQEIHPQIRVLLIDDTLDPDDSKVWAEHSIRWLGFVPDVVFSSEDYGDRFAHFLGCRHVQVDKARRAVPISGTQVRADPLACWDYLEPPARGYYARRICLVGAESTGKTTLAEALAGHYRTVWVPEYGREYTERKLTGGDDGGRWTAEEFFHIAETQCARENEAARRANRLLICDTDAFATAIWHRRYRGDRAPAVESIAAHHRRPDLYLLTDVDTPFVQDGTRDGETIRAWMHQAFVAELEAWHRPYRLLAGSFAERLAQAIGHVDDVLVTPGSKPPARSG
ncbi:MAG: AAA family ATPase [Candidatus Contendobacter sp.]|nr:AAA family ATPase [Candidatus Contendobacter sp.]MDG4556217.1 AAA family ATPase [Candidatus Contendobacter sp.]